jgi:hypothetical protein
MDTSNERSVFDTNGTDAPGESFWHPVEASPVESVDSGPESLAAAPQAAVPGWEPVSPVTAEPSQWAVAANPTASAELPQVQTPASPPAPMMAAGLSGLGSFSLPQPSSLAPEPTQAPQMSDASFGASESSFASQVEGMEVASNAVEPGSFQAFAEAQSQTSATTSPTSFDPIGSGFNAVGSGFDSVISGSDAPSDEPTFQSDGFQTGEFQPVAFEPSAIEPGSFTAAPASWSAIESNGLATTMGSETSPGLSPGAAALLGKPIVGAVPLVAISSDEPTKSRFGRLKKDKSADEFGGDPKPAKEPKAAKVAKAPRVPKAEKVQKSKDALTVASFESFASESVDDQLPRKSRFSRGEKSPNAESETTEGGSRFPRKIVIPGAMALVGLLGGGTFVAMSGGSPSANAPIPSAPFSVPASEATANNASSEAATPESTVAGTETSTVETLPDDLALTDPAPTPTDPASGDELMIEPPVEPIEVVDTGDPTSPVDKPAASAATEVAAPVASTPTLPAPTLPAPTLPGATPAEPVTDPAAMQPSSSAPVTTVPPATPVAAGRFQVASCVKVAGEVNDRTHRVSSATVTETDCQAAHNAEIVAVYRPDQNCENAAIAFVGYPDRVTKLQGTPVSFALVQDKSDSQSYCVVSFPSMPDYTGQLYGSKRVQ